MSRHLSESVPIATWCALALRVRLSPNLFPMGTRGLDLPGKPKVQNRKPECHWRFWLLLFSAFRIFLTYIGMMMVMIRKL